jgi:hypothetical protein
VVDVTDGSDVDMGLVALELGLSHFGVAPSSSVGVARLRANLENLSDFFGGLSCGR